MNRKAGNRGPGLDHQAMGDTLSVSHADADGTSGADERVV